MRLLALAAAAAIAGALAAVLVDRRSEPSPTAARAPVVTPATPSPAPSATAPPSPVAPRYPEVRWRASRAEGLPEAGTLVRGVRLPAIGRHFRTWDPIVKRRPSRGWRRNATRQAIRMILRVARRFAAAEPDAQPMLVGDLSRPRGGDFGPEFGFIGHATHQNGLDIDVYYPRRDRRLRPPLTVAQVDRALAQRLVTLFVEAGAQTVLVGPNVDLTGPAGVVSPFPNHDNHLHVRLADPDG